MQLSPDIRRKYVNVRTYVGACTLPVRVVLRASHCSTTFGTRLGAAGAVAGTQPAARTAPLHSCGCRHGSRCRKRLHAHLCRFHANVRMLICTAASLCLSRLHDLKMCLCTCLMPCFAQAAAAKRAQVRPERSRPPRATRRCIALVVTQHPR